jgi:hypothetical protein
LRSACSKTARLVVGAVEDRDVGERRAGAAQRLDPRERALGLVHSSSHSTTRPASPAPRSLQSFFS